MRTLCWSEHPKRFWTGSEQGVARLYDRDTGHLVEEYQVPSPSPLFQNDPMLVLVTNADRQRDHRCTTARASCRCRSGWTACL